MTFNLVKSRCDHKAANDKYFGIDINNKKFPSCYNYNILIMLAKRLVKQEELQRNRLELDKRLIKKIASCNQIYYF